MHQNINELANVVLLRHRLLGSSPETPSVAISIDTLELYHRLRRQHGQLSVQAMSKTLCDLHNVSISKLCTIPLGSSASQYTWQPHYRDQLSIAFDVYLDILRHVSKAVDAALERTTPHWWALNACPPCRYKVCLR